jgi:hypothetical protein
VSIERIQTSIIHIPPCSQKIIDNENPIFLRFFEDAMVTTIGNVVLSLTLILRSTPLSGLGLWYLTPIMQWVLH